MFLLDFQCICYIVSNFFNSYIVNLQICSAIKICRILKSFSLSNFETDQSLFTLRQALGKNLTKPKFSKEATSRLKFLLLSKVQSKGISKTRPESSLHTRWTTLASRSFLFKLNAVKRSNIKQN